MECVNVASKKIKAGGHNVSILPAGHANLHLDETLFFNIGDTIQERNPTTFNQVVSAANNPIVPFSCQNIAKFFAKMTFNALSSSQYPKDPQLPPCDSPVYKSITFLTNHEYDVMYHQFLKDAYDELLII
ncbi:hypothetical protein DSO57_1004086 [Entomophthora muscae]|uniref:Uncharacterized protein n=1 Tax=Entomophthora muscae TaxID=34485 RepID=A0ACC2SXI5_9FUNG|nr:hypothetical protein DSO57_1004086 [Entomophthora muscae]